MPADESSNKKKKQLADQPPILKRGLQGGRLAHEILRSPS
jgi:hypothetical protein